MAQRRSGLLPSSQSAGGKWMKTGIVLAAVLLVAAPSWAQAPRPDRFEMRIGETAATLQAITAEIGLVYRARHVAAFCGFRPGEWRQQLSQRHRNRHPRLIADLIEAYPRLDEARAREAILGMISMATRAAIEEATVYGRNSVCEAARRNRDIEHVETLLQMPPPASGNLSGGPGKTP